MKCSNVILIGFLLLGAVSANAADLVQLIGTSRGTESATHIAINSQQRPDGLVLTSSMSKPNAKGTRGNAHGP